MEAMARQSIQPEALGKSTTKVFAINPGEKIEF
jgi:hypothetical protein